MIQQPVKSHQLDTKTFSSDKHAVKKTLIDYNNIGVFVDMSNLYYTTLTKFKRKINYTSYLSFCVQNILKNDNKVRLVKAVAYGGQINHQADSFIRALKRVGFEVKYKEPKRIIHDVNKLLPSGEIKETRKSNWDVGITVDVLEFVQKQKDLGDPISTIILGSADSDMIPLIESLKSKKIRTVVFGCDVSRSLANVCDQCWEITEQILQ